MEIKYALYYKNKDVFSDVYLILKETDQDFVPSLTSKFQLKEVVNKYLSLAHVLIAYINGEPSGLVSFYVNEKPLDSYLSIIAVRAKYRGYQVGKNLEIKCLEICKNSNSNGMLVNMRKSNTKLLNSRLSLGYRIIKEYRLDYSEETIVDLYLEY